MDIRKWLDETVLPQQPPSPSPHDQRHEYPALRIERARRAPIEKHKRKQSTSDSSLLDDPRQRRSSVVPKQGNIIKENVNEGASASHPTSRSESSVSSEPYRRKPRRKTRPERYEPVPQGARERGTHTRRQKKGESKKTSRISRRNKSGKPGNDIVESFQAKNVPRDRLTLKPREKLGLFSKGRVSSPVKGRGLPDLVFSEMKFLQKKKDQPEPALHPGSPHRKRKQDQAHAEEEEIFAYFTSVRPTLAEQVSSVQAKDISRQSLRVNDRSQLQRSPAVENAIPTAELTSKASSLAFGRTRSCHESGSNISWSESILAPSVPPARLRSGMTGDSGQPNPISCRLETDDACGSESLHLLPAPSTVTRHLMDDDDVGERFQVSSLPPTNARLSRSHSLPQHTSPPHHASVVDQIALRRNLETVASSSSMPPVAPNKSSHRYKKVDLPHVSPSSKIKNYSLHIQPLEPSSHPIDDFRCEPEHRQQEAEQQTSSSSLGQILEHCNSAFQEGRKAQVRQPCARAGFPEDQPQSNTNSNSALPPTIRRIPTVRFAVSGGVFRPDPPKANRSSIYEQQGQRRHEISETIFQPVETSAPYMAQNEYFDEEEFDYSRHDLAEEIGSESYGFGSLPYDEATAESSGDIFVEKNQHRSDIAARPRFWRPHKLY